MRNEHILCVGFATSENNAQNKVRIIAACAEAHAQGGQCAPHQIISLAPWIWVDGEEENRGDGFVRTLDSETYMAYDCCGMPEGRYK